MADQCIRDLPCYLLPSPSRYWLPTSVGSVSMASSSLAWLNTQSAARSKLLSCEEGAILWLLSSGPGICTYRCFQRTQSLLSGEPQGHYHGNVLLTGGRASGCGLLRSLGLRRGERSREVCRW